METFADGVEFPTNLAFAPDGRLFFTEKETGRVRIVQDGRLRRQPFVTVPATQEAETGLLGIALHPRFEEEPWVYLYYSSRETDRNLLVRVRAEGNRGTETEVLLEALPVSPYHDGGDMAFGPDGMLYLVLGEAHQPDRAQDPDDLGGKILRLAPDGSVPEDNPFGSGNPVYSMGHRNSFGLCFDPISGNLWETENGPQSHDELNLIRPGGNYGWPRASGPGGGGDLEDPALDFPEIIVPTGCAVYEAPFLGPRSRGALFFGDFQGTLHRVVLSMHRAVVAAHSRYLTDLPGITDVAMGPDGRLYLATQGSILRLPATVEEPSPEPAPSPAPSPGPTATPEPLPTVPSGGGGAPWLPWAAAAGAVTVVAVVAEVLRRRRGR